MQPVGFFVGVNKMRKVRKSGKLVWGVGINDADYSVCPRVDGIHINCIYYQTWQSMLERCYSSKYQAKHPTYKSCTVCEEWLHFSNFRSWMVGQNHKGKFLDKDILELGNKIYSPETCIFVTRQS